MTDSNANSSNITSVNLGSLLREGESERVEFKIDPQSSAMARNMSAFANSSGGTILYGIGPSGEVLGTDPRKVATEYERAVRRLDPPVRASLHTIETSNGLVVAVNVAPSGSAPVFTDGAVLVRRGATNRPLQPSELRLALKNEGGDAQALEKLTEAVPTLIEMLEGQSKQLDEQAAEIRSLNSELKYQRTIRAKLPGLISGGAIGAVLGVAARELYPVLLNLLP